MLHNQHLSQVCPSIGTAVHCSIRLHPQLWCHESARHVGFCNQTGKQVQDFISQGYGLVLCMDLDHGIPSRCLESTENSSLLVAQALLRVTAKLAQQANFMVHCEYALASTLRCLKHWTLACLTHWTVAAFRHGYLCLLHAAQQVPCYQ